MVDFKFFVSMKVMFTHTISMIRVNHEYTCRTGKEKIATLNSKYAGSVLVFAIILMLFQIAFLQAETTSPWLSLNGKSIRDETGRLQKNQKVSV